MRASPGDLTGESVQHDTSRISLVVCRSREPTLGLRGCAALRSSAATLLGESVARRLADWGCRSRGVPPVWSLS